MHSASEGEESEMDELESDLEQPQAVGTRSCFLLPQFY